MSSSLILQQCPAYLVHRTWMVLEMGGRWLYSLVSIHVVHPFGMVFGMDTTATWKKLHLILLDGFDFHMTDSLLIAVHAFTNRILMSFP